MSQAFTIMLPLKHHGLFHQIAAVYHTKGINAIKSMMSNTSATTARDGSSVKSQKRAKPGDLYSFIKNECTCKRCYSALAKSDRIKWQSVIDVSVIKFTNTAHGDYVPVDCGVTKKLVESDHTISGYIFVKPKKRKKTKDSTKSQLKQNVTPQIPNLLKQESVTQDKQPVLTKQTSVQDRNPDLNWIDPDLSDVHNVNVRIKKMIPDFEDLRSVRKIFIENELDPDGYHFYEVSSDEMDKEMETGSCPGPLPLSAFELRVQRLFGKFMESGAVQRYVGDTDLYRLLSFFNVIKLEEIDGEARWRLSGSSEPQEIVDVATKE